jgi:hypothetical protein
MRRHTVAKVIRRQLPGEATANLTADPRQNLLGFIKLLIEMERQKMLHESVTKSL